MEENVNVQAAASADAETIVPQSDFALVQEAPENNIILLGSERYVEITGTPAMRAEMFDAWANFIGEVENPLKTAANYNKGTYAPLNEVLNEIRPKMAKYGFGMVQAPVIEKNIVTITTVITFHNGAMMVFPPMSMTAAKDDPQTLIATVTYARRASLNAIFAVYGENDDDGNAASGVKTTKKTTKKEPSELDGMKQQIVELCRQKTGEGVDREAIYNIIKENNNGNRQPNSIPDVETCQKIIAAINELK